MGLIDTNYCLWNREAMRSCCVALGTMASHLWWTRYCEGKKNVYCMCDWVTVLYSRKLREHCKPAIMEKIKTATKKKKKNHNSKS